MCEYEPVFAEASVLELQGDQEWSTPPCKMDGDS